MPEPNTTTPATVAVPVPVDLAAFLQQLQASVSVTSDIGAVANMITEICKTLQTPEGQEGLKLWRTQTQQFNAGLSSGWAKFTAWPGWANLFPWLKVSK